MRRSGADVVVIDSFFASAEEKSFSDTLVPVKDRSRSRSSCSSDRIPGGQQTPTRTAAPPAPSSEILCLQVPNFEDVLANFAPRPASVPTSRRSREKEVVRAHPISPTKPSPAKRPAHSPVSEDRSKRPKRGSDEELQFLRAFFEAGRQAQALVSTQASPPRPIIPSESLRDTSPTLATREDNSTVMSDLALSEDEEVEIASDYGAFSSDSEGPPHSTGRPSSERELNTPPPQFLSPRPIVAPRTEDNANMPSLSSPVAAPRTSAQILEALCAQATAEKEAVEATAQRSEDCAVLPGILDCDTITLETTLFAPPSASMLVNGTCSSGGMACNLTFKGKVYGAFKYVCHDTSAFKMDCLGQVPVFKSFLSHCSTSPPGSAQPPEDRKELFTLVRAALRKKGYEALPLTTTASTNPQFATEADLQASEIFAREAEKVVNSYKGNFEKPLASPTPRGPKHKTMVKGKGPFADYLDSPDLEVARMYKHDNISLYLAEPPAKLVAEEKKAREQLARSANLLELMHHSELFLTAVGANGDPLVNTSAISCFLPFYKLAKAAFEQDVAYWSAEAAKKKMETRFAATSTIKNPNLKIGFMSAPLTCNDLVSPAAAKEQVQTIKEIPAEMRTKLVSNESYAKGATFRKHTKPSPVGVPPKPPGSAKKQGYDNSHKARQQPNHQYQNKRPSSSDKYQRSDRKPGNSKGTTRHSPRRDPRRKDPPHPKGVKQHRPYRK